jgi:hypothetical protein
MGTIRLNELFERVALIRSDLLEDQVQSALVEAARKVARDCKILRESYLFTLEQGEFETTVELDNGRESDKIFKVEYYDNDLERWILLKGPYVYRPEAEDVAGMTECRPYQWGARSGLIHLFAPSDDQYAMRAFVSWVPGRNPIPQEIEFPGQAEEALIAYASYLALLIAGKQQDKRAAIAAKSEYEGHSSTLCALSLDGDGVSRSINDWLPFED